MKYVNEYRKVKGNRNKFIHIMRKNYPQLKDNSIMRRFYDIRKIKNILPKQKQLSMLKYKNEYNITSNREDFVKTMNFEYPKLLTSTIKRYYRELKKEYGEQKPIKQFKPFNKIVEDYKLSQLKKVLVEKEDEYSLDEKTPISEMKKLLWNDMKKYNQHTKGRKYLRQHGFTNYEINWLVDEGEYKEK